MDQMIVKYEDALRCKVIQEQPRHTFLTDAPLFNKAKATIPTDYCMASLATCVITITGKQIKQEGLDLDSMRFEVLKVVSNKKSRHIIRPITYIWPPLHFDDSQKRQIVQVSKSYPVHPRLSSETDKPTIFHR